MDLTRRDAFRTAGMATLAAALPRAAGAQLTQPPIAKPTKLRITQSVCQWCYRQIPLRDFFKGVVDTGLTYVDLLNEEQWTAAKEFGLTCSMGYVGAGSIPDGLNNPKHHEMMINAFKTNIPKAKAAGVPNVICFFGNRQGMADAEGIKNSIACLNQVKGVAEDNGVTICVELLNSKVDHKDYMGDHTAYGAEIARAVNSPRVKLLYDIYHMQIM